MYIKNWIIKYGIISLHVIQIRIGVYTSHKSVKSVRAVERLIITNSHMQLTSEGVFIVIMRISNKGVAFLAIDTTTDYFTLIYFRLNLLIFISLFVFTGLSKQHNTLMKVRGHLWESVFFFCYRIYADWTQLIDWETTIFTWWTISMILYLIAFNNYIAILGYCVSANFEGKLFEFYMEYVSSMYSRLKTN